MISIHAPPRGATASVSRPALPKIFQFTPLREGRQLHMQLGRTAETNFNSRPSARGDCTCSWVEPPKQISIHAPPRGATLPTIWRGKPQVFQFTPLREGRRHRVTIPAHTHISIHAPPRGATRLTRIEASLHMQFQFTPLREGRRAPCAGYPRHAAISIHAPPRGATVVMYITSGCDRLFQFTPLREGRRAT